MFWFWFNFFFFFFFYRFWPSTRNALVLLCGARVFFIRLRTVFPVPEIVLYFHHIVSVGFQYRKETNFDNTYYWCTLRTIHIITLLFDLQINSHMANCREPNVFKCPFLFYTHVRKTVIDLPLFFFSLVKAKKKNYRCKYIYVYIFFVVHIVCCTAGCIDKRQYGNSLTINTVNGS